MMKIISWAIILVGLVLLHEHEDHIGHTPKVLHESVKSTQVRELFELVASQTFASPLEQVDISIPDLVDWG